MPEAGRLQFVTSAGGLRPATISMPAAVSDRLMRSRSITSSEVPYRCRAPIGEVGRDRLPGVGRRIGERFADGERHHFGCVLIRGERDLDLLVRIASEGARAQRPRDGELVPQLGDLAGERGRTLPIDGDRLVQRVDLLRLPPACGSQVVELGVPERLLRDSGLRCRVIRACCAFLGTPSCPVSKQRSFQSWGGAPIPRFGTATPPRFRASNRRSCPRDGTHGSWLARNARDGFQTGVDARLPGCRKQLTHPLAPADTRPGEPNALKAGSSGSQSARGIASGKRRQQVFGPPADAAASRASRGTRMNTSTAMSGSIALSLRKASTLRPVCSDDRGDELVAHRALEAAAHGDDRLLMTIADEASLGLEQRVAKHDDHDVVGDRRVRLCRAASGVFAHHAHDGVADRLRCLTPGEAGVLARQANRLSVDRTVGLRRFWHNATDPIVVGGHGQKLLRAGHGDHATDGSIVGDDGHQLATAHRHFAGGVDQRSQPGRIAELDAGEIDEHPLSACGSSAVVDRCAEFGRAIEFEFTFDGDKRGVVTLLDGQREPGRVGTGHIAPLPGGPDIAGNCVRLTTSRQRTVPSRRQPGGPGQPREPV